ncbi:uncharacterized protein [Muntiacus reevesi]|uniref:uncharacterized protein isoform X2 n=1 Tax=Muntiacus reevesi TaxID=9886 RepID=UPI003306EB9E
MGRRKKKSREEREGADRKFKGQPRNKRWKILTWLRIETWGHRDPQTAAVPLAESSEGFSQLVLEGRFLEACQSISSLAEDRQDRGSQYQIVAQGMWQVIQEALEGGGGSRELQRKLRSVAAAVEWARGSSRELGGDLASWDCQLRTQLRNDAENQVPPSPGDRVPLNPGDQLGGYLAELAEAMDRGLDPRRAGWLGARLSATDRECFQEVLLDRLSVLLTRSGDPDSCRELYTWARKALFGQLAKTPEPAATRKLPDPLVFVTWMSQVQSRLVELIQKELEKQLEDVLTCDQKESATSSCQAFLKIFQLLKGTIDSVQDIGPPITSRVQAMVLNTFSEFLKRYRGEGAPHFLQQQAGAGLSPQLHVLQNCCVLRKTWQDLGQARTPLADVVLRTISAIEDRSQDDLASVSLLEHHFGREDEGLAQALRSLRRGLEHYPSLLPPPTYKSLVQSLYKAVFTEYLQALVTHLKRLKPRKWEDHRGQVETDFRELREAFGRQEGWPGGLCGDPGVRPALSEAGSSSPQGLGDGAPGREALMEVFQLSGKQGNPCLDEWLDSFSDRFPDYVRRESKAREGQGLAQGPPQACAGPSLVSLPPDTEIHPAGPLEWPSPDPFLVSRTAGGLLAAPSGGGSERSFPGASPPGLWMSCGSRTRLRWKMCVPLATSQAAV